MNFEAGSLQLWRLSIVGHAPLTESHLVAAAPILLQLAESHLQSSCSVAVHQAGNRILGASLRATRSCRLAAISTAGRTVTAGDPAVGGHAAGGARRLPAGPQGAGGTAGRSFSGHGGAAGPAAGSLRSAAGRAGLPTHAGVDFQHSGHIVSRVLSEGRRRRSSWASCRRPARGSWTCWTPSTRRCHLYIWQPRIVRLGVHQAAIAVINFTTSSATSAHHLQVPRGLPYIAARVPFFALIVVFCSCGAGGAGGSRIRPGGNRRPVQTARVG